MVFNSFQFLWLFPIIFAGYYFLSFLLSKGKWAHGKVANLLLIFISYGLYIQWQPQYVIILLGVTAITYFSALLIDKDKKYRQKKTLVFVSALLTLLPLLVFKYADFITNSLCNISSIPNTKYALNLIAPLGISFFTFQAIGYLFDVYYQRTKAEYDWWSYMLFVCFFPQILAGPISKAKDLLPQIKEERPFDYNQAVEGLKLLLWGMFMKVVMADRLGLYVDTVFDNYVYYSGISCFVASICYTFQIYGDFAGYSLMAIGVGRLLGFNLINNFNHPYLSASITEFWRRWHISLSTWLKDYVYIPLGGNRCSKIKCYWNIFLTFLVSGIWHGANWTFILWGVFHGVFQIIEKVFGMQKCESNRWWKRVFRIALTFLLVNFAWILFRMPSIEDAIKVVNRVFTKSGTLFLQSHKDLFFSLASVTIVVAVETYSEFHPNNHCLLYSNNKCIRWCSYTLLALGILLCGVFDSSQFIYVSF
ncbi:MBOAT family O-acyltransferase [Bacteroides difficilis]|uniref:MBOAT family protein n=1 Tax=Bacteroides difficilis TaxID=2763021 RepID=A0ABR7CDV0_9BACE|nr:MBOAT family O-acyltransferase [Bacteroides difficilis]MBC5605967.1 MBOAT family protein [Bacteroides difficilis]